MNVHSFLGDWLLERRSCGHLSMPFRTSRDVAVSVVVPRFVDHGLGTHGVLRSMGVELIVGVEPPLLTVLQVVGGRLSLLWFRRVVYFKSL